jgi:uncharacterized membrane protein YsdA (DUF1294 family)
MGLVYYFIGINLVGFCLMAFDKRKAINKQWRVPEARIWLIALVGGALGIYIGMISFRHKTKHKSFTIGVPLVGVLNLAGYFLLCSISLL